MLSSEWLQISKDISMSILPFLWWFRKLKWRRLSQEGIDNGTRMLGYFFILPFFFFKHVFLFWTRYCVEEPDRREDMTVSVKTMKSENLLRKSIPINFSDRLWLYVLDSTEFQMCPFLRNIFDKYIEITQIQMNPSSWAQGIKSYFKVPLYSCSYLNFLYTVFYFYWLQEEHSRFSVNGFWRRTFNSGINGLQLGEIFSSQGHWLFQQFTQRS